MRLIGKSSVASGVQVLLGFINILVAIGGVAAAAVLIVNLVSPDLLGGVDMTVTTNGQSRPADDVGGLQPALLAGVFACGLTWLVIDRLRGVLKAVNRGEAFVLANVRRLQTIGVGLIGLQLVSLFLAVTGFAAQTTGDRDFDVNLGAWLSILVVFILAEVFRQGADLRDETLTTV